MQGFDVPYVPGWDCHGLPIEHKVVTELAEAKKLDKLMGLDQWTRAMAIRRECQKHAEKYVKLQSGQMQRLLTLGDYANPYLTMSKEYEAATLEVLEKPQTVVVMIRIPMLSQAQADLLHSA
jgi:isoleucyl-tRNA synthetase